MGRREISPYIQGKPSKGHLVNRFFGWVLKDAGFVWRPTTPWDGTLAHRRAEARFFGSPASRRARDKADIERRGREGQPLAAVELDGAVRLRQIGTAGFAETIRVIEGDLSREPRVSDPLDWERCGVKPQPAEHIEFISPLQAAIMRYGASPAR